MAVSDVQVHRDFFSDELIHPLRDSFTTGRTHACCGYWLSDQFLFARERFSDLLHLPVSSLEDIQLANVTAIVASPQKIDRTAFVYLDVPDNTLVKYTANPGQSFSTVRVSAGTALVVPAGTRLFNPSSLPVALVHVGAGVRQHRGRVDYYVMAGIYKVMVEEHTSNHGMDFFSRYTRDPVYWHTFAWVMSGTFFLLVCVFASVCYTYRSCLFV